MDGAKVLGLTAVGALLVMASLGQVQAASLINPGAAVAVQRDAKQELTTEVRWHWHHHHRWHGWHHRRWWHRHHWRHHRHW